MRYLKWSIFKIILYIKYIYSIYIIFSIIIIFFKFRKKYYKINRIFKNESDYI